MAFSFLTLEASSKSEVTDDEKPVRTYTDKDGYTISVDKNGKKWISLCNKKKQPDSPACFFEHHGSSNFSLKDLINFDEMMRTKDSKKKVEGKARDK